MSCSTTTSSKATKRNTQTKLNGSTSTLQLRGHQQCVDNEAIEAVDEERQERVKRLHCRNNNKPLQFGASTRSSTIIRRDSSITVTTTGVTTTGINIAMTTTKNNAIATSATTLPSTAIAEETRTGTGIAAATTEGSIAEPTTGATIAMPQQCLASTTPRQ
jgi:hypothetical protein